MKDVSQHTFGLKRGCLVSFGNRRALIWITHNCHSGLFWISPERLYSSSPPLCLSPSLSCVMWLPQKPISKHQAEFTASFQVFVFLPLPLFPLFPVIIKKRCVEIWIPFMTDSPVCSWNVPPVVGQHVWCVTARWVRHWIFSGLLLVSSGSAVIDYEIQRRAFGRHTSPLAHCLTTIDFLGPCLCWCIKRALSSPWYKVPLITLSLSPSIPPDFFSFFSFLSCFPSLLFLPPLPLPPLYSGPICAASVQCIMYKELFIFDACCGQIRGLGDKM